MKYLITSLAMSLMPLAAFAEPVPQAWDAFVIGQYEQSAAIAESDGSAENLVLASSAIVAKILALKSDDIKDDAKRARKLAEAAISLDPNNGEAFLQYAVSDGIVTRATGTLTVWRKKLPQKTYAAVERAQSFLPEDPRVDALFGAWHLGIVRKAGEGRARKMFDANAGDGIAAFERAVSKAPNDVVIVMNYALSSLTVDPEIYGARAKEMLVATANMPTPTALEKTYQSWAQDLLAIYDDEEALVEKAEYLLDGE